MAARGDSRRLWANIHVEGPSRISLRESDVGNVRAAIESWHDRERNRDPNFPPQSSTRGTHQRRIPEKAKFPCPNSPKSSVAKNASARAILRVSNDFARVRHGQLHGSAGLADGVRARDARRGGGCGWWRARRGWRCSVARRVWGNGCGWRARCSGRSGLGSRRGDIACGWWRARRGWRCCVARHREKHRSCEEPGR